MRTTLLTLLTGRAPMGRPAGGIGIALSFALVGWLSACKFPPPPDVPGETYDLTIARAGFGTGTVRGTVTTTGETLECASECSVRVATEGLVTLTAMAAPGDTFFGWSGGGCSNMSSCTVAITERLTITATFDQCDRRVAESCDDARGTYERCSPDGEATFSMECPLYCSDVVEKCVDLGPSDDPDTNPLDAQMGLVGSADQDLVFPGTCTAATCSFDTTTGEIVGAVTGGGAPSVLIPGVGRVFRVRALEVRGGIVKARGGSPLVVLSQREVAISGILDASADLGVPGPGAQGDSAPCSARAHRSPNTVSPGGGGAGRFDFGGGGGNASNGTVAAAGGARHDDLTLMPLLGGCEGGWVDEAAGMYVTSYGAGGGAVHLVSRASITLFGNGVIDVSGGGGRSGDFALGAPVLGGPGGGSGGAILLEAPSITMDGAGAALSAKGGGGAAAGAVGFNGNDGGYGPLPAAGGASPSGADGGAGGTESIPPQRGQDAQGTVSDGGGGGGSVGVCRLNTRDGAITLQNGAAIRCRRATNTTYSERLLP